MISPIGWMLGLMPAVATSVKPDEEKENKKNLISEADILYNEHSYTKLRNLLLQYKVNNFIIIYVLSAKN